MVVPVLPTESIQVAIHRFPIVKRHAERLVEEGKVVNKRGENLLKSEGKPLEWGSEELKQLAMSENVREGASLLGKNWQLQAEQGRGQQK